MCVGGEHEVAKHPEDFTLFKVGTWNDGTAEIESFAPEKLINGVEAIAQSRKVNGAELEVIDKEIRENA
jgi:transcriptional regulator NrdR family protein